MERDELTVHIDIPAQMVDPATLEKFARALKDLIAGASDARWAFTSLAVSSLVTAARPVVRSITEEERELAELAEGLAQLENGRLPRGWDREALSAVETLDSLAPLVTIGVGARLPQRPLAEIAKGAKALLKVERMSIGSVEGVIESVNLHGSSPRFGVLDSSSGRVIAVNFARHFESQVMDLFHARASIVARGRLFRDASGEKRRLTLESLRELGARSRLSVRDVVGALGDLPQGVDSVEWIRRQRD